MSEKERSTSNKTRILYIIFSIVASIALWTYVTYVENPETKTPVNGIPIEFTGEDVLLENNLTITSVNTRKLNITFSGRWNVLTKLSDSDITASVDLSEIVYKYGSNPGTYMLSPKISYSSTVLSNNVSIASQNYSAVTVTVEKSVKATIPVKGSFDNVKVASGYIADQMSVSVDSITVSGPQAVVSEISYAWVQLDEDNLDKSISTEMPLILMDEDGNEISSESLVLSQDTVVVTVDVLMVKEVPLTLNCVNGITATSDNIVYSISPKTVTLSGDPDVLSGINQLTIGPVDLTDFALSWSGSLSIIVPNDVNNLTGETTADVSIEVLGVSSRRISVTNIDYRNVTDGYNVNIITQSLDVTIRGDEELINSVEPENIRIVADLTDYGNTTGSFTVAAKVYIDGDGFSKIDAIGDYSVNVLLTAGTQQAVN